MRGFLLIVAAGLGSAALGCGVGWVIGNLSPEFIALLAQPSAVAEPARMGAAMGLVSGLLLGAGAMALGLLVEAFREWIRGRAKPVQELPPDELQQTAPVGGAMSKTAVRRADY